MVDEEQHVLRYWEREFGFLKPQKNESGNRMYDSEDIAIIKELKRLIRTERKTIQEARIAFLELHPSGKIDTKSNTGSNLVDLSEIQSIQEELQKIIKKLRS